MNRLEPVHPGEVLNSISWSLLHCLLQCLRERSV